MVVILSAARTPIGLLGGKLRHLDAPSLGAHALRAALRQARIKLNELEEVIFNLGVCAGAGSNPAYHVLHDAASASDAPIDHTTRAISIVGGVHALPLAIQAIAAGRATCVAVGGVESASLAPYLSRMEGRQHASDQYAQRVGRVSLEDTLECDAGAKLEAIRHVSSEEDEYVLNSHKRSRDAWQSGAFDVEVSMDLPLKRDEATLREEAVDTIAPLAPLGDGGACVILCNEEFARKRYLSPLATITNSAITAGPAAVEQAVRQCWAKNRQIDFYELPDRRAKDLLDVAYALKVDATRINVHGGALSLGWAPGLDGVRSLCTLIHALTQRGADSGISVSHGSHQAAATVIKTHQ